MNSKLVVTNRLAGEKSPYLLQHQHNPVDWQPWGEAAFAQARQENKPIFLSIGYSTCHWCHVMERESFEDEQVAAFLNAHFISIKLDREERPDVDRVYMTFVQATAGQGGWPLNVFLTPDLKPFYGGTYFPPDSRYGRPGLIEVLRHLNEAWLRRQSDLAQSAGQIHARLEEMVRGEPTVAELPGPDAIRKAGLRLKQAYDAGHGGFGQAPKFPQPSQAQLLLRYAKRFQDSEAERMVLFTCDRMAAGGIHDQLGGGFSRYSVDEAWLVPHFEKMLYDNAQLVQLYLDAHLVSGQERYAQVARDILDYVRRDMTQPEGGFASAEDADSEGHEGKFYCWTRAELAELLAPDEFKVAVRYYGVTEGGNFVDHSHPAPLPGQNVLSVANPELSQAERSALVSAKQKLLAARAQRPRPHLDDKVLASWNGLMLGAFARASVVLGERSYRETAERNLGFLESKLWDERTVTLGHRWRDGERDQVQLLSGYAFLLSGVVELYEATLEPARLNLAITLAESMLTRFFDRESGGFWQSPPGASDLVLQVKEDYDGAEPSGNSVAVLTLLRLGRITGREEFIQAAEKSLQAFARRLEQSPQAVPFLLQGLDFALGEPRRVVIAGDPAHPETRSLLAAVHRVFQPNKIVLGNRGAVEPFAVTLPSDPDPQVYLCSGQACQAPTRDTAKIKEWLGR
jgi:uncharacterized protein